MAAGKIRSAHELSLAAAATRPWAAFGPETEPGRALARACVECHGPQLDGVDFIAAPDLTAASGYSNAQLSRLLRTGTAADGHVATLMAKVVGARFSGMSETDIASLLAYLKARAAAKAVSPAG